MSTASRAWFPYAFFMAQVYLVSFCDLISIPVSGLYSHVFFHGLNIKECFFFFLVFYCLIFDCWICSLGEIVLWLRTIHKAFGWGFMAHIYLFLETLRES